MDRSARGVVLPALLVALVFVTACGPGGASRGSEDPRDRGESQASYREVTALIEEHGGDAADCLSLEDEIARLGARLEANEKETFAELEIVYEPKVCAVAYFTRDGQETIGRYTSSPELENAVRVEAVDASLQELEAAQNEAHSIAKELDVPISSDIDVTRNRVELYPPDRTSFEVALREAGVELPDHVVVLGPENPARPPENSDPDLDVFFPRQRFGSESGGMMALIQGKLTLDGRGCLRIEDPRSGHESVPIWPADFGIDTSGDEVRVMDKDGRTVATVGREIEIGGGEIFESTLEGNDLMEKPVLRELLERCPGGYWLVTAE